ncbi:MAG: hypothetical protein HZC41_25270 [Chloroflexi bacterium]|nr:hypothetical protein [Chloroflexota bacterium]
MEKEKRKPKKKPQPDEEFVTFCPVEECAARVKSLQRSETFGFLRTTVAISPMVNGTRDFSINRTCFAIGGGFHLQPSGTERYNYVKIQIQGTLSSLNTFDQTLVTLKSRTQPITFVVNGCWFVLFGPAILLIALYFLLEGAFFMALLMFFMLSAAGYLMIYQPILLGDEYQRELASDVKQVIQK